MTALWAVGPPQRGCLAARELQTPRRGRIADGTRRAKVNLMLDRTKAEWQEFKHWPPGRRFDLFYVKHHKRGGWVKALFLFLAFVSFVIGVILAFIPGPAILFFVITAALGATQSRWLAARLDEGEVFVRERYRAFRARRARRRALRPSD
jgi:hypothetical protein